jgi:hypothetical protein
MELSPLHRPAQSRVRVRAEIAKGGRAAEHGDLPLALVATPVETLLPSLRAETELRRLLWQPQLTFPLPLLPLPDSLMLADPVLMRGFSMGTCDLVSAQALAFRVVRWVSTSEGSLAIVDSLSRSKPSETWNWPE